MIKPMWQIKSKIETKSYYAVVYEIYRIYS